MAARKFVHATVPLKDFLKRRVAPIDKVARPLDTLNVIAKVTFGGELFLRNDKAKRGYKGPLFEALPGDLIISKIRVGQGSFCVIGDTLDHVAVSPEYPIYAPDPTMVDRDYLAMVIRTPEFMAELTGKASGNTTKRRIRPEFFETRRIPLPPLPEQQAIVSAWRAALDHAAALEREAAETEAKSALAFESALGFTPSTPLPDRPIFVANFKDIERWSHDGILRAVLHIVDPAPKFATSPLSSVGKVSYGLQKFPGNRPTSYARPYLAVVNVQRWRLDLNKVKMISVPDEDMPKYRLEYGDVLLCEGNSPELVGRGAIWRDEIPDCVHQNHVLRVRLDQTKALPEFVLSVINSSYGQAYFRSKAKRTTNLASINSKEVGGFPLPLPTVPEQQDMIDQLFGGQAAAKQKREEAAKARAKAWTDFETAVYSAEVVEETAALIAAAF